MRVFSADWVLPITSPPLRDGAVAVEGGRIVAVGPRARVLQEAGADCPVEDLSGCVLLPGLVNAHCHLEYTALRDVLDGLPFFDWIRGLTRFKYEVLEREDLLASSRLGCLEAILSGTTTLGEQSDEGASVTAIGEFGLRSVCYLEAFGQREEDARPTLVRLEGRFGAAEREAGPRISLGLTPHSPYTSGPETIRAVAERAARRDLPLSIHADESPEEMEFLRSGTGTLARHWKERGFDWRPPTRSAAGYLDGLGFWRARPPVQAVHLVHADASDWTLLAERRATAVLCPRSNALLGVGPPPVAAAAAAGLPVGLGTDSAASSGTLEILEEARAALSWARIQGAAEVGAAKVLEWITLGGARSLGLGDRIGSLEPGKIADLAAFSLTTGWHRPVFDPVSALIQRCGRGDLALVAIEGEVLVRRGVAVPGRLPDPVRIVGEAERVGDVLREARS